MNMDFEQLRVFLVLADQGTFLGAANQLETSRSRVRRKLDQLERAAGTPLLSRAQSGLELTPAGRVLQRRGRALLEDAEHLIAHVHEVGSAPTGRLKVALPIGPAPAGWEALRSRLQADHPGLQVEALFDEAPTSLLPDRAELALTFEQEIPVRCDAFVIDEFPVQLFVSDLYLSRFSALSSVEALSEHRVALWRPALGGRESLPLPGGGRLDLAAHFLSDDASWLFALTRRGECIGFLPALPELLDPSLKVLFGEQVRGRARQRLVVPQILADVPRVKEFVALARSAVSLPH